MSAEFPKLDSVSGPGSRPLIAVLRAEFEKAYPKVELVHPAYSSDRRWHAIWQVKGDGGSNVENAFSAPLDKGIEFFTELRAMMPADDERVPDEGA